jgi:hypothetical protein
MWPPLDRFHWNTFAILPKLSSLQILFRSAQNDKFYGHSRHGTCVTVPQLQAVSPQEGVSHLFPNCCFYRLITPLYLLHQYNSITHFPSISPCVLVLYHIILRVPRHVSPKHTMYWRTLEHHTVIDWSVWLTRSVWNQHWLRAAAKMSEFWLQQPVACWNHTVTVCVTS